VHVQVDHSGLQELQIAQARLLRSLGQRRAAHGLAGVDVTAHLQPAVETAVMMEQEPAARRIDDEAARGDVAGNELVAGERIEAVADEVEDVALMLRLPGVGRPVRSELLQQFHPRFHHPVADGNQ